MEIKTLKSQCKKELTERIIPFWNNLKDDEHGGFYGGVDFELEVDKQADKGLVLMSRILWFYSSCYSALGDAEYEGREKYEQYEECLANARHAYNFIKDNCFDPVNGGVYWMVTYDGNVADDRKYTYCQAFTIYALCAYYKAAGDNNALKLALELFAVIESK